MTTDSATTNCKIEHHAILFALFSKYAICTCGEDGKQAILEGITTYGNERGARMAQNAISHGDELNLISNQAYGEWKPDYSGQMEFGSLQGEPTFQTYISKCAWCDAWEQHDLLAYGKLYCVNIDNAVFQGFRSDYECTPISTAMSWGGTRCEFDWGQPLTSTDIMLLNEKKAILGSSCMKDFNFHTAHLLSTISCTLIARLGSEGEKIVALTLDDFANIFGKVYLEAIQRIDMTF